MGPSKRNSDPNFPVLNMCVQVEECPKDMPCSGIKYIIYITLHYDF